MIESSPIINPRLEIDLKPVNGEAHSPGIGFTVVNFNTSAYTLNCIKSLADVNRSPSRILVLDNGSDIGDFQRLLNGVRTLLHTQLLIYRSEKNLGFAAGTNFLVDQLLDGSECRYIGLLNNDAVAQTNLVEDLLAAMQPEPSLHGMAGGRMHKLQNPQQVDTLGISIYSNLMPADRLSIEDVYLGPTGGCCLLTRECVESLISKTGYFFDARFFCYCEDTDMVLRANLLGYQPVFSDTVVALHMGQASSGTAHEDFIAYHGWRNVIWMHAKLMPTSILLRKSIWLVAAHVMSVANYLLTGNWRVLWRVYSDAAKALPDMLRERKRLRSAITATDRHILQKFDKKFYRTGYISSALHRFFGS